MMLYSQLVCIACLIVGTEGWSAGTRRQALWVGAGTVSTAIVPRSLAFENKISTRYDDRPKRRGPQPKDLGVATRSTLEGDDYLGLKGCGAAPNCFSSSIPDDPDHSIPAWKWPPNLDQTQAFETLKSTIEKYQPGENGIDGGGFAIKGFNANKGYLYVQFESLKNGYIDDLEVAIVPQTVEGTVQVRSGSRIGYLDFGVNAKRLNAIANSLKQQGWDAAGVDYQSHPFYVSENELR